MQSYTNIDPKISIIIPLYNAKPYISRCLQSCINQTLKDIEIIVVDDCGSDNSIETAKEFATKDQRVKIILNPHNLGTFATRAKAIMNAKAPYCMFVDSDDFLTPDACAKMYEAITKHDVDILQGKISHYPKSFLKINPIVCTKLLMGDCMREFLNTKNNLQSLCDKIIKTNILKDALKDLDFIDKKLLMLEDGLLVLVSSFYANKYMGINDTIYFYCNNPTSITKSNGDTNAKLENLNYLLEILEKLSSMHKNHSQIIDLYKRKVISTMLIETRTSDETKLKYAMNLIQNSKNELRGGGQILLKSLSKCLSNVPKLPQKMANLRKNRIVCLKLWQDKNLKATI